MKLIGPAGKAVTLLEKAVARSEANDRTPLLFIISGPPGIGKSSAARYLVEQLLKVNKFEVAKYSGTQVRIDTVEELARSLCLKSLFSPWRALWIDEVDHMPRVAQVRFLTLLDDIFEGLKGVAVVVTCNSDVSQLEERFNSRFTPIPLQAPKPEEIGELLQSMELPQAAASMIAMSCCGNVRMAIKDANSWLLCQEG